MNKLLSKTKKNAEALVGKVTSLLPKMSLDSNKIKLLALIALLIFAGKAYQERQVNQAIDNTVMITNLARNSGGSGVIMSSSETESVVLTNRHVCEVVKNGGLVIGKDSEFMATKYLPAEDHDLCAISVSGNLHGSTKVSSTAPKALREEGTIAGHPRLLPTVITKGAYSDRKIIQLVKRLDKCTEADAENIYCIFLGVKPVFESMESTVVAATIQAGSSGSAIYNKNMELTNLVFAGSGDLSYAFAVPYEYVANFTKTLKDDDLFWMTPDQNPAASEAEAQEHAEKLSQIQVSCATKTIDKPEVRELCKIVKQSTLYTK